MRAAIYARYSSDKQRETSLDDQMRNCAQFAERHGFEVTHHYFDSAISGSTSQRPEYQRMLKDAANRAFDVLLVDDLSRLSRDDIEMKLTLRKLKVWEIRLVGVSDGTDSDSKSHKLQASMRGIINEVYLDDLREKTHRGLTGQALKGFSCGGRVYGYKPIPIEDKARIDEYGRPTIVAVRREIDQEQAKWVRQIYYH